MKDLLSKLQSLGRYEDPVRPGPYERLGPTGLYAPSEWAQRKLAWADYLDDFNFDWWATTTFRKDVGADTAKGAWRDFNHFLRKEAGHRVEWFRVDELQRDRGVVHFHALMGNCRRRDGVELSPAVAQEWWEEHYGRAEVEDYDPEQGARGYLARKLCRDGRGEIVGFRASDSLLRLRTARGR